MFGIIRSVTYLTAPMILRGFRHFFFLVNCDCFMRRCRLRCLLRMRLLWMLGLLLLLLLLLTVFLLLGLFSEFLVAHPNVHRQLLQSLFQSSYILRGTSIQSFNNVRIIKYSYQKFIGRFNQSENVYSYNVNVKKLT